MDNSIQYDSLFATANPVTSLILEKQVFEGEAKIRQVSYFSDGKINCIFPMSWDTIQVSPSRKNVTLEYVGLSYCLSHKGDTLNKTKYFFHGAGKDRELIGFRRTINGSLAYPRIEFSKLRERYSLVEEKEILKINPPWPSLKEKLNSYEIISNESGDVIFKIFLSSTGCLDSISPPEYKYFTYLNPKIRESKLDSLFFCLPTPRGIVLSLRPMDGSVVGIHQSENFDANYNYYILVFERQTSPRFLGIEVAFSDTCVNRTLLIDTLTIPTDR